MVCLWSYIKHDSWQRKSLFLWIFNPVLSAFYPLQHSKSLTSKQNNALRYYDEESSRGARTRNGNQSSSGQHQVVVKNYSRWWKFTRVGNSLGLFLTCRDVRDMRTWQVEVQYESRSGVDEQDASDSEWWWLWTTRILLSWSLLIKNT